MFINATPDSRSLDMVNLLSVLNEHSHSADVIGNVHKMRIKVCMLERTLDRMFWDWNFINIIDVRAGKMS